MRTILSITTSHLHSHKDVTEDLSMDMDIYEAIVSIPQLSDASEKIWTAGLHWVGHSPTEQDRQLTAPSDRFY